MVSRPGGLSWDLSESGEAVLFGCGDPERIRPQLLYGQSLKILRQAIQQEETSISPERKRRYLESHRRYPRHGGMKQKNES
jgi:hypothetical protein